MTVINLHSPENYSCGDGIVVVAIEKEENKELPALSGIVYMRLQVNYRYTFQEDSPTRRMTINLPFFSTSLLLHS